MTDDEFYASRDTLKERINVILKWLKERHLLRKHNFDSKNFVFAIFRRSGEFDFFVNLDGNVIRVADSSVAVQHEFSLVIEKTVENLIEMKEREKSILPEAVDNLGKMIESMNSGTLK